MSTKKFVTETNTQVYSRIKAEEKAASDLTQIQQQVDRQNRSLKREMSNQASDTAEAESLREALLTIAAMKEDLAKFQVMEKEYYSNIKIHADAKLHADESRQLEIIAANHRLKQTELRILKYDNPTGRTSTEKKVLNAKLGASQPTFSGEKYGMTVRQWVLTTEVNLMTTGIAEEYLAYVAGTYLRKSANSLFLQLVFLMPTGLTELYKIFEPPYIKMLIYNQIQDLKQSSCPTLDEFIEKFRS
jgi:ATPase subunit of ABC transporter with duplicated ATPase domains